MLATPADRGAAKGAWFLAGKRAASWVDWNTIDNAAVWLTSAKASCWLFVHRIARYRDLRIREVGS
jgi:hypothetical protein